MRFCLILRSGAIFVNLRPTWHPKYNMPGTMAWESSRRIVLANWETRWLMHNNLDTKTITKLLKSNVEAREVGLWPCTQNTVPSANSTWKSLCSLKGIHSPCSLVYCTIKRMLIASTKNKNKFGGSGQPCLSDLEIENTNLYPLQSRPGYASIYIVLPYL